ncbi:DUF6311 domain-containing protein [Rhodanobacter sp. BL-MT-08]
MNFPKTGYDWTPWLSLLMGLVAFWIWGGAYTFAPGHLGWIMSGLDTPSHYQGWQFFRHSTWWQWPIGNNPANGSDAPGTIVLSDSIPLVAIPLKLLSPLLPDDFQYFGLWALSCFFLQGWFAGKLMGRLSSDPVVKLLGTAFFLGASIFLMRVYLHPALSAQWVLLAAFYLLFDSRFRANPWCVLLCAAVLVHAYLFAMLSVLWLADMVQRLWRREYPIAKTFFHGLVTTLMVLALMWAAGYLVHSSTITASIRSHLDLFFPLWTGIRVWGEWSRFLPASDMDLLAYDGFGYFGLGFILMLIFALAICVARAAGKIDREGVEKQPLSRWIAVWVACGLLLFYALGNKIYFAQRLLFSYPLATWLDHVYDIFRASARMMWPTWYLLLFVALYVLLRSIPVRYVRYLLAFCLLVQFADLSKPVMDMRSKLAADHRWHSAMTSTVWVDLASRYKHVGYLQPVAIPVEWVAFVPSYHSVADFAAINGMTINIAYLAREDQDQMAKARAARIGLLKRGLAEPETFYVVEDQPLWKQFICVPGSRLWYGTIDGLHIVVPDRLPDLSARPRAVCGA